MSHSNQATSNLNRILLKQNWWKQLLNMFNPESVSGEGNQNSSIPSKPSQESLLNRRDVLQSQDTQSHHSPTYQAKARGAQSSSSGTPISDFKRLEGGWTHNNFPLR